MNGRSPSETGERNCKTQRKHATYSLGAIDPAGSRHMGRRSTVLVSDGLVVVGTASGTVTAVESALDTSNPFNERWSSTAGSAAVVSSTAYADGIVVGERGPSGAVRLHDRDSGDIRWRYATADDVGKSHSKTRFALPFVVDAVENEDRLHVAARRYERNGGNRDFTSVVYSFDTDGDIEWQYPTDASPISLAAQGERVAVGYNRCTGDHQQGLVVLDASTGEERWSWDPATDGQRRIGDVALLDDNVIVTSHGDYCGYCLDMDGEVRWRADLATPKNVSGETLYAYPNHAHAMDSGIVFITGNTYSKDGRETESLHPNEHTIFGYSMDGEREWSDPVGGFVNGIDGDSTRIAIPSSQNFRTRDPAAHALRVYDVKDGPQFSIPTRGVATAASISDSVIAIVEEPITYHDEGTQRGQYRIHADKVD
jgi:outer membrane protein assembly factor BamB